MKYVAAHILINSRTTANSAKYNKAAKWQYLNQTRLSSTPVLDFVNLNTNLKLKQEKTISKKDNAQYKFEMKKNYKLEIL